MLNTILVDDEVHALESLSLMLSEHCPQVSVVAQCRSGKQALEQINAMKPDLLFLDIEMPNMSGFEVLSRLSGQTFDVIFTTAYHQYAINAIRISAMDYLLKPVAEDELVRAVIRAEERLRKRISARQIEVLLTNIKGLENGFQKLAIPTQEGLNFVNVRDIMYCNASGNYTQIYCAGGEKYMISKTLKDTEEMLSHPMFFRTHQSFLVNLDYISQYFKGGGGYLVLRDGTTIQVARSKKDALLEIIYRRDTPPAV